MVRLNIAIAALIVSTAGILACAAHAGTTNCAPGTNAISFNADYGLKNYLLNIGTPSWDGKKRIAFAASTAPCGTEATAAYSAQQRFYTLLRAFPQNPTRAQWNARYRPLMQAAIATDAAILAIVHGNPVYYRSVSGDKAWLVANQRIPFGSTPQ